MFIVKFPEKNKMTAIKRKLDENEKDILDSRLQSLLEQPLASHVVQITYFQPGSRKAGGIYI